MLDKLTNILDLFGSKSDRLGIEINSHKVNIVQIDKKGEKYKLTKSVSADVPEGIYEEGQLIDTLSLAELIKNTLKANKIKAKKVATAIPMREAIIRVIPVPAELNEEELQSMIFVHEAGMHLPYPVEEVDLDYTKLGYFMDEDGIEKVNILLVATRKEVTDHYLEVFQQAELEVEVLEINSFALIRTIREQLRSFGSREAVILVDLEFDSTEIAIVVEGVPQFSRTVPIGTYQMRTAFSEAVNLPTVGGTEILHGINVVEGTQSSGDFEPEQLEMGQAALLRILGELTEELSRSINFYISQSEDLEISQLLLAGPGAGIEQVDEFFTQKLNLPTSKIDPIAALGIDPGDIAVEYRPSLGTVLGLGIREI